MKIIHIVTIAALALGLSQMAYANHDGSDGMHCDHKGMMMDGKHKGMMMDADTNKDGTVSHDEFMSAHQARADKMFTKMDANKDGKIDQSERDAIKTKMKDRCNMKDHKMHEMNQDPSHK